MKLIRDNELYAFPKAHTVARIVIVFLPLVGQLVLENIIYMFSEPIITAVKPGSDSILLTTDIMNAVLSAVFIPLYLRSRKRYYPSAMLDNKVGKAAMAIMMTVGIATAAFMMPRLLNITFPWDLPEEDIIIAFISGVILAPIAEEFMLRGFVLNRALSVFPTWLAVLITAALFGLVHWNLYQGIPAFIIGIFLCLIYIKYRSIVICVLVHAAVNVRVFLPFYDMRITYIILFILSAVGIVLFVRSKGAQLTAHERGIGSASFEQP